MNATRRTQLALLLVGMTISTVCGAHSAMYRDDFKYDSSNENQRPLQGRLLEQARQASTCSNGLAGIYPAAMSISNP